MPTQTTISCSACGQPFPATIRTYINVADDPEGKYLLLTGRLNNVRCAHCGSNNRVVTPLLFHDPEKELLISHIPMELNFSKDQQEKVIGEMLNVLPKTNFKGYMFNPRRALTLQGLTDMVLEADGVTPEMMEAQRTRVQLAQKFVEAQSEDELRELVRANDATIDEHVFQVMTIMAQRAMQEGQAEIAQHIMLRQNIIAEESSFGQEALRKQEEQQRIITEVAGLIQQLPENAERGDFLNLALSFRNDDERLFALVSLVRPAFDYEFFEQLTQRAEKANGNEQQTLLALRERLSEITAEIDREMQQAMHHAAGFLQAILDDTNPEDVIRANLPAIDDTFMAVLASNIKHAEQDNNQQAFTRLKEIYDMVVRVMQENIQPELRFVNDLLATQNDEDAQAIIEDNAGQFDDTVFEVFDAVEGILEDQGNAAMAERLRALRARVEQVLN